MAVRLQRRQAAEAAKQVLLEAQAKEQEQFERIKQEFGVDTATVRSAMPSCQFVKSKPCYILVFAMFGHATSKLWQGPSMSLPALLLACSLANS